MLKETITESSEGELVWLKYTFKYGDKFDEPNDDWLKCIEVTSDELLGSYSKAEDNALSTAFGSRGKKRLNRIFDAIGSIYPDYRYPLRRQGKKRKATAVAASAEPVPKAARKKMKVLTHRPRYIEPVVVPKFGGEASLAAKSRETVPPAQRTEEPTTMPKLPSDELAESKTDKDKAEESNIGETKVLEILSPSLEITAPKAQKSSTATPKRRRMVNVLDVLETVKTLNSTPSRKIAEALKAQTEAKTKPVEIKATTIQADTEAGPLESSETEPVVIEEKAREQVASERTEASASEASKESTDYIICHASGKRLSQAETLEALHYAQKLKYLKGALVFNGSGEEDFLYCLPDSKEISVCREMGRSFGFSKLEDVLSILSKDELADSLAYNSIKVQKSILYLKTNYFICLYLILSSSCRA
jgi:hypothetical protein